MVIWVVEYSGRRGLEACPPGVRQLFFLFAAGPLLASPLQVLDRLLVLVALFEFKVIVTFGLYCYNVLSPMYPDLTAVNNQRILFGKVIWYTASGVQ